MQRWWSGDRALGTWGDLRPRAVARGIVIDANYVHNIAGNPVGGRRQGITYTDNLHLGLRLE
ncbi:MAG TPA: hypothetical protein VI299_01565, partial [Polyangiales bacterium]